MTSPPPNPPPTEVRIASLLLRPWAPDDAAAYAEAVQRSHDHLRRFEGWARLVPSLADSESYIDWCRQSFERGSAFVYGVFDAASGAIAGSVGLYSMPLRPDALTLGYWTDVDHTNRGVATFAAAAATWLAFGREGIDVVEAHCDVANDVSARIPRRLGYRLIDTRPRPKMAPEEVGRALVFSLARADYPRTYGYRIWNEEHR